MGIIPEVLVVNLSPFHDLTPKSELNVILKFVITIFNPTTLQLLYSTVSESVVPKAVRANRSFLGGILCIVVISYNASQRAVTSFYLYLGISDIKESPAEQTLRWVKVKGRLN